MERVIRGNHFELGRREVKRSRGRVGCGRSGAAGGVEVGSYGFKKPSPPASAEEGSDKLDFSGIERVPVALDPRRQEVAVARSAAMGFVHRDERVEEEAPRPSRRETVPQGNLFIKGPQATLDWFVEYSNSRGRRSYWQTLEELRARTNEKAR